MKKKLIIMGAGVGFLLLFWFHLGAEVALDEVIQAGRFVFYRDHADPHKYYYVPDEPRLATKRDGTPEFTFIKYTKTDGATKGGIVHFLVTWGYTSGELNSAESALVLKDPQAKVAGPVPFKEGTFRIISATAGEGGLFTRRIVGEGKAPVMPGQKAAVSIALTEEGASLLWESFKNPTSDVSVQFMLKFAGVTPAFQAKLKVDWDKVYSQHDIKLAAEGTIKVVKIKADVRATLEELRQKGAIQLDVVGENENMQKMLDTAYEHILQLMCDKVPMGSGATAAPSSRATASSIRRGDRSVLTRWSGKIPIVDGPAIEYGSKNFYEAEAYHGGPNPSPEPIQSAQQDDCPASARQQATLLENRANSFLSAGQFREAVESLEKAYSICPDPKYLFSLGSIWWENLKSYKRAREKYDALIIATDPSNRYPELRDKAKKRIEVLEEALKILREGVDISRDADKLDEAGQKAQAKTRYLEAVAVYQRGQEILNAPAFMNNIAGCYYCIGDMMSDRVYLEKSLGLFKQLWEYITQYPESYTDLDEKMNYINEKIVEVNKKLQSLPADQSAVPAEAGVTGTQTAQTATGAAQQQTTTQQAQAGQTATAPAAGQTTSTAAQTTTKPPETTGTQKPATTSGKTPPTAGAQAPEVKPIVSVDIGYSFKRIKLSGKYEVDMRKRLREDREVVMSGNVSGVYQKYGEDKRFFTVVSLDDPTFQERSVEVILDGQDADDFKNYINSVSVIFRKQRFAGPMMTGEVKFFEQQFAERGNRLSFKYGRVNEASTEWLDYEYKTKWNFYGGIEWESDWTGTSDSVITLSPPVKRRTIEISVDEDNILKNGIKAVAIQIKHKIFGKDILKEVVINYDRGDPLQANYTYLHEEGKAGYSFKAIWLTLDGKEVETNWVNRESPFVYAVFAK